MKKARDQQTCSAELQLVERWGLVKSELNTLAELRAGELGYGVLDVESRFSVEENVACSCFSREGRLEALQLGFTPTSRSGNTRGHTH